jgi:hypothetical protein
MVGSWCRGGGQSLDANSLTIQSGSSLPSSTRTEIVAARDNYTRLWEITKFRQAINPASKEPNLVGVKSYVREIGCGICYKDPNGVWQVTDANWRPAGSGFVVDKANYHLATDGNAGSWLVHTVKGVTHRLRPAALKIANGAATGDFAILQGRTRGFIDPNMPNKLVFQNAFGPGIDMEYVALRDGYHQNVVFRTRPVFASGIDVNTAKFIIATEIAGVDSGLAVQMSDVNTAGLTAGSITATPQTSGEIAFASSIQGTNQQLYSFGKSSVFETRNSKRLKLAVAKKSLLSGDTGEKLILQETLDAGTLNTASYPVVWDYRTVSGVINSNQNWYADATYYLSSDVTIAYGVTVKIQPGTVIKVRKSPDGGMTTYGIYVNGTLIADGNSGNYITFTSSVDNTIGEYISYGTPAYPDWSGIELDNEGSIFEFCRFSFGMLAVFCDNMTVQNCIFNKSCLDAEENENTTIFNNLLIDTPLSCAYNGENINIINNTFATTSQDPGAAIGTSGESDITPVTIVNNLITGYDTGIMPYDALPNASNNAYYGCSYDIGEYDFLEGEVDYSSIETDPHRLTENQNPFDTTNTQLGSYFLAHDLGLESMGTKSAPVTYANLHDWSIFAISNEGVYLFTGEEFDLTGDLVWQPNSDTCDLGYDPDAHSIAVGYHHPRVDYCINSFSGVLLNGHRLTILPGTVIAMDSSDSSGGGIFDEDGTVICTGTPENRIQFIYRPAISENRLQYKLRGDTPLVQVFANGQNNSEFSFSDFIWIEIYLTGSDTSGLQLPTPIHDCRFCFDEPAIGISDTDSTIANCIFEDNGYSGISCDNTCYDGQTTIKNCTFDHNYFAIDMASDAFMYGHPSIYTAMTVKNCAFTNNAVGIGYEGGNLGESYNAFYGNTVHHVAPTSFALSTHDMAGSPTISGLTALTGADFYSGWTDFADRFYLPQSSPKSQLVDGGDPADGAMPGYTTDPTAITDPQDAIVDAGLHLPVDIGYHYPVGDYWPNWLYPPGGGACATISEPQTFTCPTGDYCMEQSPFGWHNIQYDHYALCPATISATFVVEDSQNCSLHGGNPFEQYGAIDFYILLTSNKIITCSIDGVTERRNSNVDFGKIYFAEGDNAFGDSVAMISGTQELHECYDYVHNVYYDVDYYMMEHSPDLCPYRNVCTAAGHIPYYETTVYPSSEGTIYRVRFEADTIDGLYHTGEYFTFTVTIDNPE